MNTNYKHPLSLLALLTTIAAPALGQASTVPPNFDISSGEIITMGGVASTGVIEFSEPAGLHIPLGGTALNRWEGAGSQGCDSYARVTQSYSSGTYVHEYDSEALCQYTVLEQGDAVPALWRSMGLDQVLQYGRYMETEVSSGDGKYNSVSNDGARLVDAIESLPYLEQQLFGDVEIHVQRETDYDDVPYQITTWAPTCEGASCSEGIGWDHEYMWMDDGAPAWASELSALLSYFGLEEWWSSTLLYLDFTSDDNDNESDFRDGIAAALNALQAHGENDPLTSIFTKLSATSRVDASSEGVVGEEQPLGFHFLIPDTDGLETWATNTNYAVPESIDWAVCYDIQLTNGIPHDPSDFKDFSPLLEQMKSLGLLKHYHVVGDGLKPFFAASGSWNNTQQHCISTGGGNVSCSTSSTTSGYGTVNGFFFAYDTADEEVLQLLDTADYACSFEAADRFSFSNWLNRDDPGGGGDYESATYHHADGTLPCTNPLGTEVRRVSDGLDAHEIGDQRFSSYNHSWGFTCKNGVSGYDNCDDYEVRYYCANVPERIQITRHDKCIDLAGGNLAWGTIQQWSCQNDNSNQVWELEQRGDYYRIRHTESGQCIAAVETALDYVDGNTQLSATGSAPNGAPVRLWPCDQADEDLTLFTLTPNPGTVEDDFTLRSKNSNKCLDLSGGNSSNGTVLHQWDCNLGNPNQNFARF